MSLPDFSRARVLVVGDIMLDRYWSGPTGRVSPEAPVPVVNIHQQEDRPGGAANVALNLAALGAQVTLSGLTGDDASADDLERRLNGVGVDCLFERQPKLETITKLRVLSRHQQLIRLDFEQDFSQADKSALEQRIKAALAEHDMLLLSDYNKGTLSQAQSLIRMAKEAGCTVVVDPKGTDYARYQGADLLTPNMHEFSLIQGEVTDEADLINKAHELIERLSLQGLLVTRSEQGMTLVGPVEGELHLPAKAKEVYDVTGAGDTVIATLAAARAAGCDWPQSCSLANAAASIVVGKLGTSTVSVSELAEVFSEQQSLDHGVVSEEQLKMALKAARARGERLVMTNGCFDILHAGHVSYLQAARQQGDRLIVAVNSDASVTRLKGPGRPVNSCERRMSVLAGLASVDWVVPFGEDTPQRLIAELLPDVLVKGGDYRPEEIAGSKEVWANGGEVKVLNFEDGVSTTGIIDRIRQRDD
ncbi:D-glycero-beta-D-manno-heptose-7-phosphate kinase [Saliniradius amylolyticus]|uniref:Bifunctional protein HldE n=2 Tax=Saliniradius amylolyticus TaxID=2183582 RepID=A0A2S2E5B2_9ALTE|nr:D-glycero-beta-D-manno-heptose-7-phosphate kinase [Saliniradius amylolyticus]